MGGTESVPIETNEHVRQRRRRNTRTSNRPYQPTRRRDEERRNQKPYRKQSRPNRERTKNINEELSAYEMLSLRPDCTIKELQKKYKQLAQIYHPDRVSFEGIISKAEKGILEKKQRRTANALCVKDLEKLNEEELKLLSLKDFWDATKKV